MRSASRMRLLKIAACQQDEFSLEPIAAKERSGVGVALQEIMRRHFNIFNWLRLHKT